MKNKFFILFILIFVLSSSCCFASATLDNVDVELFENIINHFVDNSSNFDLNSSLINNLNANDFYTYFLTKKEEFKDYLDSINATNKNLIIFITSQTEEIEIAFIPTNNTVGDLEYIEAYKTSSSQITVISPYKSLILEFHPLWSTDSLQSNIDFLSSIKYGGTNQTPNFRFKTSSIIINNENMIIDCACFYGLNAEPLNILNYKTSSTVTDDFYYTLTDFTDTTTEVIYPDNPPSGDSGSGDTGGGTTNPSGDTPGTTTPNYNEKLDNIQTGITNIENKIPTSGEVQEVISGTLNEAFGKGSGEVTSEQIDNLQNDVNEIMGDIVPANNFIGMFNQIISAFSEALLGQGEETIEFEHRGENYVISSNQINLPIAEIKGFLSIFFNVAIVMAMALTISWIIRRMEEGDLISVLHMGDADMYFYEDLNLF